MSQYKHEAKQSRHEKLKSMGLHKDHETAKHFNDTHPYDGVPLLTTDENSGLQPVGKQRFRRGGKVAHAEGHAAKHHLGKKPRAKKNGGGGAGMRSEHTQYEKDRQKAVQEGQDYLMDSQHNEGSLRDATRKFEQTAKETDFNRGGRTKHAGGGLASLDPAMKKRRVAALAMRKKKAGLPYATPTMGGFAIPHKKGGSVHEHMDEAADKKLIRSMVKGSSLKHRDEKCWGGRAHKNGGGGLKLADQNDPYHGTIVDAAGNNTMPSSDSWRKKPDQPTILKPANKDDPWGSIEGYFSSKPKSTGGRAKRATGGRTKKADGGGMRSESTQLARAHRRTGGRATTINLIVDAGQKQPRGMAQVPAGGAPAMNPALLAAMAGGAPGAMPPGGAPAPGAMPPGAMPPGAGMAGAGPGLGAMPAANVGRPGMTPPTPPMRKSGGRVGGKAPQAAMPTKQEHDYGSGSGLGRLEKRKWYPK